MIKEIDFFEGRINLLKEDALEDVFVVFNEGQTSVVLSTDRSLSE